MPLRWRLSGGKLVCEPSRKVDIDWNGCGNGARPLIEYSSDTREYWRNRQTLGSGPPDRRSQQPTGSELADKAHYQYQETSARAETHGRGRAGAYGWLGRSHRVVRGRGVSTEVRCRTPAGVLLVLARDLGLRRDLDRVATRGRLAGDPHRQVRIVFSRP